MRKEYESREHYQSELERSRQRLRDIEERGIEALSKYDREIAFGGDEELTLRTSTYLVSNHVAYFTKKLEELGEPVTQLTLFDPADRPPKLYDISTKFV